MVMRLFWNAVVFLALFFVLAGCQGAPVARDEPAASVVDTSDDRYIAGDHSLLIDLGIASEEDLDRDEYISTKDALQAIHRVLGFDDVQSVESWELSDWYMEEEFEPLDHLDDVDKKLLLDLSWYGHSRNSILNTEDIPELDFTANLLEYEALTYITRMIGNTYSCVDYPEELDFTEASQTYEVAYEKGIVDSPGKENADAPILRKAFYDLIHKALFVELDIGGYAPTTDKYIDAILRAEERASEDEEVVTTTQEIPVEATINDDMSISWVLPDEWNHLSGEDMSMEIQLIKQGGEIEDYMMGSAWATIETPEIIECVSDLYPDKLAYIRCMYYEYNDDYTAREEWYFDVDLSGIEMVVEGEPVKPGVYTRYQGQWVPESISLAAGELFRDDVYYLLTSYEHTYRKPEYNSTSRAIFMVDQVGNVYHNTHDYGGAIFLNGVGGVELEEIHIQEISIQGSSESGFVLHATPESADIFVVEEGSEPS